jgi:hypothetical protein
MDATRGNTLSLSDLDLYCGNLKRSSRPFVTGSGSQMRPFRAMAAGICAESNTDYSRMNTQESS